MSEGLRQIRAHVETAHREVQAAQRLAYSTVWRTALGPEELAPLRVRLALNKAQTILIKLLVHRLPSPVPPLRGDEYGTTP